MGVPHLWMIDNGKSYEKTDDLGVPLLKQKPSFMECIKSHRNKQL